jgi:uncharacterized protein YndB with AHSA1/START domain
MSAAANSNSTDTTHRTTIERKSDRELVVTRIFNAPPRLVFEAWSKPELFKRWWVPKSAPITLLSCDMDVRTGGTYKLVFAHPDFPEPMPFFGKYIDVVPPSRIVWTNEEAGEQGQVTTVTFEDKGGKTLVVMHDLYPSKDSLDEALASGSSSTNATTETFDQLDQLLMTTAH